VNFDRLRRRTCPVRVLSLPRAEADRDTSRIRLKVKLVEDAGRVEENDLLDGRVERLVEEGAAAARKRDPGSALRAYRGGDRREPPPLLLEDRWEQIACPT
jgi:hypothetical protein